MGQRLLSVGVSPDVVPSRRDSMPGTTTWTIWPLVGVTGTPCGAAPCHFNSPHNVESFSFKTPGPGSYNWQCFVPCALGYLFGNGGAMSTQNYMGGELEVVNS